MERCSPTLSSTRATFSETTPTSFWIASTFGCSSFRMACSSREIFSIRSLCFCSCARTASWRVEIRCIHQKQTHQQPRPIMLTASSKSRVIESRISAPSIQSVRRTLLDSSRPGWLVVRRGRWCWRGEDLISTGSSDTLRIRLSNGYSVGGTLTSGDIRIR